MRHENVMCNFFNFSAPTYYKRKRELNPAISFIEKYFTKEELEEFLNTGKIAKFDKINNIDVDKIELLLEQNNSDDIELFDYVCHNIDLKKASIFKLEVELSSFLYFFQKINEENPKIELRNAKKIVLEKIQNEFFSNSAFAMFQTTKNHHQKSLYNLIDQKYSNIEVYVLIKKNIKLK